jgi:hypothetical protein
MPINSGRAQKVLLLAVVIALVATLPGRADKNRANKGSQIQRTRIATGMYITPLAAPGSTIEPLHTERRGDDNGDAANAVTTALSSMVLLCSS